MEMRETPQGKTVTFQVPTREEIAAKRPLIPGAFAAAIILFFFTFCDLKCTNGQHLASVRGINLVTGTTVEQPTYSDNSFFGQPSGDEAKKQKIDPNFWAILAFIAAIVGLYIFIKKHPKENLIGSIAGAGGALSLIFLWFSFSSKSSQLAAMQIVLIVKPAFWLAVLSLIGAGGVSYLRYRMPISALQDSLDDKVQDVQEGYQTEI